jgi:hypothetical protein
MTLFNVTSLMVVAWARPRILLQVGSSAVRVYIYFRGQGSVKKRRGVFQLDR